MWACFCADEPPVPPRTSAWCEREQFDNELSMVDAARTNHLSSPDPPQAARPEPPQAQQPQHADIHTPQPSPTVVVEPCRTKTVQPSLVSTAREHSVQHAETHVIIDSALPSTTHDQQIFDQQTARSKHFSNILFSIKICSVNNFRSKKSISSHYMPHMHRLDISASTRSIFLNNYHGV